MRTSLILINLVLWFGLGFMSCMMLDRYAKENQENYVYRVDTVQR